MPLQRCIDCVCTLKVNCLVFTLSCWLVCFHAVILVHTQYNLARQQTHVAASCLSLACCLSNANTHTMQSSAQHIIWQYEPSGRKLQPQLHVPANGISKTVSTSCLNTSIWWQHLHAQPQCTPVALHTARDRPASQSVDLHMQARQLSQASSSI